MILGVMFLGLSIMLVPRIVVCRRRVSQGWSRNKNQVSEQCFKASVLDHVASTLFHFELE
jgi:hypothetical protein